MYVCVCIYIEREREIQEIDCRRRDSNCCAIYYINGKLTYFLKKMVRVCFPSGESRQQCQARMRLLLVKTDIHRSIFHKDLMSLPYDSFARSELLTAKGILETFIQVSGYIKEISARAVWRILKQIQPKKKKRVKKRNETFGQNAHNSRPKGAHIHTHVVVAAATAVGLSLHTASGVILPLG